MRLNNKQHVHANIVAARPSDNYSYREDNKKSTPVMTCDRIHLDARCRERGYTLDEVMPCVVSQDGDDWTIDVEHPAYPRHPRPGFEPPQPASTTPAHGPGTELSKLLKRVGINPTPTCACRAKAAQMDAWGCDEASRPERIEEVVCVMRQEAKARGLPFVDIAARLLVRRAIANARKAEARRAKEASQAAAEGPAA